MEADPYIGRLDARSLALSPTVITLKKHISQLESFDYEIIDGVLVREHDQSTAADDDQIQRSVGNPGTDPQIPFTVIVSNSSSIQYLNQEAILSSTDPDKVPSSDKPLGWRTAKAKLSGMSHSV